MEITVEISEPTAKKISKKMKKRLNPKHNETSIQVTITSMPGKLTTKLSQVKHTLKYSSFTKQNTAQRQNKSDI